MYAAHLTDDDEEQPVKTLGRVGQRIGRSSLWQVLTYAMLWRVHMVLLLALLKRGLAVDSVDVQPSWRALVELLVILSPN